ncbi:VOC family protein [Dyella sp. LX-66]|uniref:VOC family protein n=1 Tax=unclassified Dyella TaxID=2634549 RepID=UPI001BE08FA0|nr:MULTISPECIES: VOC family protein [unclassified Dyella]MBT2117053.1 VOC family protein [Dyella sp. LX-1]MBT2139871.1 VOC family protein [Dyella sp. LX-66]
MSANFPAVVPEMPVGDIARAIDYYQRCLGFTLDWGGADHGGIAGISKGACRLFLTDADFRQSYGNAAPILLWINLQSRDAVDELHRLWSSNGARIVAPPESKSWKLHEFTAADPDGNLLRVFYDFSWETA